MAASTSGPSRRIMHCSSDSASIRPDVTGRNPLDFFSLSRTSPTVMLTTSPRPLSERHIWLYERYFASDFLWALAREDRAPPTAWTASAIEIIRRLIPAPRPGFLRYGEIESAIPHRSYNPTFGGEVSGKEKSHDQEGPDAARYGRLDGGRGERRGERRGDGGDLDR